MPTPLTTPTHVTASGVSAPGPYTGLTHTVTPGSNRLLLLFVQSFHSTDPQNHGVSAVTYGGQAMTAIPSYDRADGVFSRVQAFYLKEAGIAAASSNVFSMTTVTADAISLFTAGAVALSDVDQTTPFGTAAVNSGNSGTASVSVASATGELVVGSIATDAETGITETGTLLFEDQNVGSDISAGAQYYSGAATVTVQWSLASNPWAVGGVSVKPAGAGGDVTTALTGVAAAGAVGSLTASGGVTMRNLFFRRRR